MEQEEHYEQQMEYFKALYPKKRVAIGECIYSMDRISNFKDIKQIIEQGIKCQGCGETINSQDWIVVLHNTSTDEDKPMNVLLFCKSKNCAVKWEESRRK